MCLFVCVSIRRTLHWGGGYPGPGDWELDDLRCFPAAFGCVCVRCQSARHQNETYCPRTTRGTRWGHIDFVLTYSLDKAFLLTRDSPTVLEIHFFAIISKSDEKITVIISSLCPVQTGPKPALKKYSGYESKFLQCSPLLRNVRLAGKKICIIIIITCLIFYICYCLVIFSVDCVYLQCGLEMLNHFILLFKLLSKTCELAILKLVNVRIRLN